MPFRSERQRRKLMQLEKEGRLKKGTVERWDEETTGPLPERATPKKKAPTSIQEIKEIRVKKYGK